VDIYRLRFLLPAVIALFTVLHGALSIAAPVPIPAAPSVSGTGHLLIDHHSGRVLAEKNADERLEPASLTKIMTAYVAFRELAAGKISLDDQVHVSEKAWKTPGSRMFIEVGTKVRLGDLLKGMIIQSGNDASVAIAEHIAGSEGTFAQLMNTHAHRLGMTHSHFVNSTGLPDPQHYTTARDIAKVSSATIREFPEWYAWYAEKQFTYNDIKQHNRNKLLWRDDSVDGVKTGHTEAAGYCLVASAERDGMRLISVVMGTGSENARAEESQALLSYGFRFYETHRPYQAGAELKRVRVWKGDRELLGLGLQDDLYLTIPRGAYDRLEAHMDLDTQLIAPVQEGQQVGSLRIDLDGNPVVSAPLVALNAVAEGGLWAEVKDTVLLWLE
jgi:D-alanyl-D-alanine carboxypeptidase (penicillin-binding protein 5/6)